MIIITKNIDLFTFSQSTNSITVLSMQSFTTPLAILPKYLWNDIITYLPSVSLLKLVQCNSNYAHIIRENNWKDQFLLHRAANIAVVKCDQFRIRHFWLYALVNHIIYDNINDALLFIESDNVKAHYKIFIKAGVYSQFDLYNYSNNCYSVELIGSGIDSTIIENANAFTQRNSIRMFVPTYLVIKHIAFDNIFCGFNGAVVDLKYAWYDSSKWIIDFSRITNLHLMHCKFNASEIVPNNLTLEYISSITISHCVFNNVYINLNNIIYGALPIIKSICIIDNSVLSNVESCVHIDSNHDFDVDMLFTNNTINNVKKIFSIDRCTHIWLKLTGNCITNISNTIYHCVNAVTNIKIEFENNQLHGVARIKN